MKNLPQLGLLMLLAIGLLSCYEQKEDLLSRNLYVEFNEIALAPNPENFAITLPDNTGLVRAQVNLIGANIGRDEVLRFRVAPESTAQAGIHYLLSGETFLVASHCSMGFIDFTVLESSINQGNDVSLILELEGNEMVQPSKKYNRQTYLIKGK